MAKSMAMDVVRKAHEEGFFGEKNTDSLNKIRIRAELRELGIGEEALRDALVNAGFNIDSIRALVMFPVIQIAWASGRVEFEEKLAIEKILLENGIEEESSAHELILLWLEEELPDENRHALEHLTDQVIHELTKTNGQLPRQILEWSNQVANAYAGLLSFGGPNMTEEEAMLIDEVKKKFC